MRRSPVQNQFPAALAVVAAAVVALSGCKSSPTKYSSPRVVGTVVDAQTKQPLKGVRVRRLDSTQVMDPNMPRRGGEVLAGESTSITSQDGAFVVKSVADLSMLRNVFWYTVNIAFAREGYETQVITYTPAQATNAPSGEPVVNAGNIFLQAKSR